MNVDPEVIVFLPRSARILVECTAGEYQDALAKASGLPEWVSTVDVARAWGFTPRKWREWAVVGLIEGAVQDEGGTWRLPRDAAREQFERALGRDIPRRSRTAHLPKAHGPRKKREATS